MSARESWLTEASRPRPAPAEYSGRWVAWNRAMTDILAHGDAANDAFNQALACGHPRDQIVLQKVPRAGTTFIGGV